MRYQAITFSLMVNNSSVQPFSKRMHSCGRNQKGSVSLCNTSSRVTNVHC